MVPRPLPLLPPPSPQRHEVGARARVAELLERLHAADGDKSDLQRVAKTYERAIQIFEKELGKDHATVINTLFAMSAVLDDAGDALDDADAADLGADPTVIGEQDISASLAALARRVAEREAGQETETMEQQVARLKNEALGRRGGALG